MFALISNVFFKTSQGRWSKDPSLLCLPHVEMDLVSEIRRAVVASGGGAGSRGNAAGLPELVHSDSEIFENLCGKSYSSFKHFQSATSNWRGR